LDSTDKLGAGPVRRVWAWLSPTTAVLALLLAYLGFVLFQAGGNPVALAQLGDGFVDGQPIGKPGYDGQFSYWLAVDPLPAAAEPRLDVPAYRYQRILYPLLARTLAFGQPAFIPWTLILVNLIAQVGGTLAVEYWLLAHGVSPWYALTYGLWVGLVAAVRLDLNEPVCYALVAAGYMAQHRGRLGLAAACLGLAVFAKETALVFIGANIIWAVLARSRPGIVVFALAALPFAIFQLFLRRWFGAFGVASGGAMATPFEWIPFMGLWRIALVSLAGFVLLAVILVPLVVGPSMWGLAATAWRVWHRDHAPAVLALGANAAVVAVAPFSTFREPLGIVRLATGLVLSTVLFAAHTRSRRALTYSLFWIAALALLVRG
jgi:hypothetical protein